MGELFSLKVKEAYYGKLKLGRKGGVQVDWQVKSDLVRDLKMNMLICIVFGCGCSQRQLVMVVNISIYVQYKRPHICSCKSLYLN